MLAALTNLVRPLLILAAFYAFLVAILNILPESEALPNEVTEGVQYFFALLRGMDFILPMDAIMTIFGLTLIYISVKWAARLALWILQLIGSITSI